ncbi:hypothetical protein BSL78_10646 [Apostichopus japonicus]|uniref:Uncharacterized protein n=1 Tax=Stichopus japonicus TaxID=307972 RepID=A0A2G8KWU8_STIJA|nr:hypothetical protein BSL78_10646 [Apostichopus japonicus]
MEVKGIPHSFSFRFSTLSQSAYAIVEFVEKQSAANAVEEEKQTMNGLHIVVRPREVREFVSSGITQRKAALEGKKKKEDNLRLETQMLMAELVRKKTQVQESSSAASSSSSRDADGASDGANPTTASDGSEMEEDTLDPDQAPEEECLEFVAQIIQKCVPSCHKLGPKKNRADTLLLYSGPSGATIDLTDQEVAKLNHVAGILDPAEIDLLCPDLDGDPLHRPRESSPQLRS